MSPEKNEALCKKYPKIFKFNGDLQSRQPIAWGFECGDGWYDILDVLCNGIQNEVDHVVRQQRFQLEDGKLKPEDAVPEEDLQFVAVQVKEKFGGLRFYGVGGNDRVWGMISMAEGMSYKTCEDCGVPGKTRKGGWIRVLCDACNEARNKGKTQHLPDDEIEGE